ncbi:MAG TPA: alpha-L-fucosidase [Candidatus Kryptobacter bacterium]|nr:alpha-L-fucosidase [Candidatus Kryptobacter bacterium]
MRHDLSGRLILPILLAFALLLQPAEPQRAVAQTETPQQARMQWWVDARFGMFIHWGIYAIPAKGEWYMSNGHVPRAEYEKYAKEFDPTEFNADEWAKIAHDAGMKYLVITSKHHDGFCMFDTKATDYSVVKATPWHKDPLKALSAACRKYGVKFAVYYSIMDWHSPYQEASDPNPEHPTYNPTHFKPGDKGAYIEYMKTQLKELVTQYHPAVLWFDGGWMEGWTNKDGKEIYDYLRKLDPKLIVNNRVGGAGDYETPEQQIPPNGIPGHDWETCMTINDDWGYNATDFDFKSSETLIRNLVDIASKGGNYLLNVGPTAKGVIPEPEVTRLDTMGAWLKANGDAIYGSSASPFTTQIPWGRCTQKPGKLYLEVFDWPANGELVLHGLYSKPDRTFILWDMKKSHLKVDKRGDALVISVPTEAPDKICSVVELDFAGIIEVYNPPVIGPALGVFLDSTDVTISMTPGADVRYTLDGQPPTNESPMYTEPVTITGSTSVAAQYFRDGNPVSGATTATFKQVEAEPSVKVEDASNGVQYEYFEGNWQAIPDFSTLTPAREGVLPNLSLPPKRTAENYGVEYTGYIMVPKNGIYIFYTNSDDGSKLYVGGKLVVDNDGLHGGTEKKGVASLAEGYHPIRVEFFQATGSEELQVQYEGPGIAKQPIPDSMLYFKK